MLVSEGRLLTTWSPLRSPNPRVCVELGRCRLTRGVTDAPAWPVLQVRIRVKLGGSMYDRAFAIGDRVFSVGSVFSPVQEGDSTHERRRAPCPS